VRTDTQKALDAALLLYILKNAAPIFGRAKLQKTTFLVEVRLKEKGLVGPHFRFIRYVNGPFSRQLWDTFDELAEAGFVSKTGFRLTDRGRFLLDLIMPELRRHPANRRALKIIDGVLESCRRRHGAGLINEVYQLEVAPEDAPEKRMKVVDIPFGTEIIAPPPEGLQIAPEIEGLLKEELTLSEAELKRAELRLPEIERRAIRNLSEALSADPPA
jgi:uncharacterized protein YwgA